MDEKKIKRLIIKALIKKSFTSDIVNELKKCIYTDSAPILIRDATNEERENLKNKDFPPETPSENAIKFESDKLKNVLKNVTKNEQYLKQLIQNEIIEVIVF